jgi:3-hydroxybutyryl-CoA dehydratase
MSTGLHAPPPPATGLRGRGGDSAWLRPFDELAVGETHRSRARTLTETDLFRFATLSGDSLQGGAGHTCAGTVLPLSYSIGLVSNSYIVALRRVLDFRPILAVGVGDTIHVECRIERLEPWIEDYGLVTGCWAIVNQDGVTAMTVLLEAVWRRAPL